MRVHRLAGPASAFGALALALFLPATPALAQEGAQADRERAERAFKHALADEQAGQYEKAAGELLEARTLAHKDTPQLLFHLGVCHAHLGRVVLARDELRAAVERAQAQGLENVALTARAQLEQVQVRVATLTVARPAHRATKSLTLDGVDATPKLGAPIEVDPGRHVVQVSFAEGPPAQLDVSVAEGEKREVAVSEGAPAAVLPPAAPLTASETAPAPALPPTSPEAPSPLATPSPASSSGTRTLGWITAGSGVALLAGGAVFWVLRGNVIGQLNTDCVPTHQTCPSSDAGRISDGKLFDALGVTGFVAGGAAVLSGLGLALFAPGGTSSPAAIRLSPMPIARGAGVGLEGALQ
jgi:hypothetical protein